MNKIQGDKGHKCINRTFAGVIDLGYDLFHYLIYNVTTNIAVTLKHNPAIGGSAEMRMLADGSHAPVFDVAFTKSSGSADYDTTTNAVNKVVFYYDGYKAFYSITVL